MTDHSDINLTIRVIETAWGHAFAIGNEHGFDAVSTLRSDEVLSDVRLVIQKPGEAPMYWYIAGNAYDYDTVFSAKRFSWFEAGATPEFKAADHPVGTIVSFELDSRRVQAEPESLHFIFAIAVWQVLAHSRGSAHFVDHKALSKILVPTRAERQS